jgi:hypothetical protein
MRLVSESSWDDGCLFGRPEKEDSRGRPAAAHDKERCRPRFRGEPLLSQALREGRVRRALPYAGEGPRQEAQELDEKARRLLEADLKERPFAKLADRREYLKKVAGVSVSESTLSRALRQMGFGRKKGRCVPVSKTSS